MRAVWMVRLPQIKSRIGYWLSALGYQYQDRSINNRVYFLYFLAFWSAWIFAVLSLLAGTIAKILESTQIDNPNHTLALVGGIIFLIWVLVELFRVSRISPFIFSEADVYLICQTPVNRRFVALVWFLGDWLEYAIIFWAGGVILGFASVELQIEGNLEISELVLYLYSGFRAFLIILLLQLACQALVWSFGTMRLRGEREVSWLPIIPLGLAAWLSLHFFLHLGSWVSDSWHTLLSYPLLLPIYYPFQAVAGQTEWFFGVMVSLSLAVLSLGLLWMVTGKLNLSRAAAETYQQESIQMAVRYGKATLAQKLQQRKRLGLGRRTNMLPDMPGVWSLLWKDILQTWRSLNFRELVGWLTIFGFTLGILLIPEWSLRALALVVWVTLLGDHTTKRFRDDLSQWWLFRLLPFKGSRMVLVDLVLPWVIYVITGWLALVICRQVVAPYTFMLAGLLPFVVAGIIISAANDILRQSRISLLLVGEVPKQRALASFLGIILVAIPVGILWWLGEFPYLGGILACTILVVLDCLVWRDLIGVYRRI
ncbi:MAG: hypothetical protein IMY85_04630 [Chloroflexi bacterium]|nr:hypothetical protein [Chloroflexota bacterium]